jgi:hypothetical protein
MKHFDYNKIRHYLSNITPFYQIWIILFQFTATLAALFISAYLLISLAVWLTPLELRYDLVSSPHASYILAAFFRPHRQKLNPEDTKLLEYTNKFWQNHLSVGYWLLDCKRAEDFDRFSTAGYRELFPPGVIAIASQEGRHVDLSHQIINLLHLSRSIAIECIDLKKQAQNFYYLWQIASLITILLGMITTILVTLGSTDFGKDNRAIRILAIVFPALGTATAAVVAFYSPQLQLSQASHTLAGLSQLQNQIVTGVWNIKCNPDSEKELSTKFLGWEKRYDEIEAVAAAAAESAQSGGTSGSGADTGKAQPDSGKNDDLQITNVSEKKTQAK